ncbi:uncharacterized protein N7487_011289 [Penicillium crustosum]|uniref:uncharacterized protein n=1 Tax=Penicillium crustosum TaxID=36656 RepID=UPI0023A59AB3|nr:uncharacterized protein N7487_011289 [Penicillium crustosum]KAJ5393648.1 hypothetical protein N7487_011289 [Penicillium crustosum]
MEYGCPSKDVKWMRNLEPSREIVLSEMTPLAFCDRIKNTTCLRAATAQIVGTKPLASCVNCEKNPYPFTECVMLPTLSSGCCANCIWKHLTKKCSIINGVVPCWYKKRPKVIPRKVVLQGKVTKLKREVRYFDDAFKEIRTAMLDFLNGSPNRAHQFKINGGLMSLKSHVDGVLEAMKRVTLKEDEEEDHEAEEEVEAELEEEKDAEVEAEETEAEETEEVGMEMEEEDDKEDD